MNVLIIEDEKPAARRLQRLLEAQNITVQTLLHSVEESINWFHNNEHPDLIFLDIQLSDGLSFEIFDEVKIKSFIIFTTAYDEYALKAFKLNSIDYLLKPIDEDELIAAVNQYKKLSKPKQKINIPVDDIRKLLINPIDRKFKKRFTIQIGQHIKIVHVDEVECVFSENKSTYIFTTDKRSYLLEGSLEGWENILDPEIFLRVNRTFMVNINAIKDIVSYTNRRLKVVLNNYKENEIIVSRERVKDFKHWIDI